MDKDLLIYGAGGAGRELAFSLSLEDSKHAWHVDDEENSLWGREVNIAKHAWRVTGFIDDDASLWGREVNDIPVKGGFDWLKKNGGNVSICLVADPHKKEALIKNLKTIKSVKFPLVIGPGSSISDYVEWGEGCLVAHAYNYITVNIKIGDFVFINCGNAIGHDVEIGDYTTVYSHSDISGGTKIGSHCIIGSGVTINPSVRIGNDVIVGAGSVVVRDVPDNVTIAGVPAKVIKKHTSD